MSNEPEVIIDPINEEGEEVKEETPDEGSPKQEDKQEKPVETPEARKARLERQLEQHRKKYPELYKQVVKEEAKPKSDDLDYGQKAYLAANDIKAKDEITLVKSIMNDTGKTLEQVLESRYFQAELKEMREMKQSQEASDATAKSKRSANSAKNEVDYWIAKGELPEDRDLRVKVINARRANDNKGNPFRR